MISVCGQSTPARSNDMESTISRVTSSQLEVAAGEWLRASGRLARAVLRAIGHCLVHYSRAALLLRSGERPFRRI